MYTFYIIGSLFQYIYEMLKEYLKQELIEDSKIKAILEKHSDRIIRIINQDEITYEDFKRLVNVVFKKSEKFSEECPYAYKMKLQGLYDEYRLFRRFFSNKERAEKLVKALRELSDNKSFQSEEDSEELK